MAAAGCPGWVAASWQALHTCEGSHVARMRRTFTGIADSIQTSRQIGLPFLVLFSSTMA